MKKMLHRILNVGLILTLGIVSSCSKDDTGDNPPTTPPDENQAVVTDVVTPIKYYEQSYTAGENGVSVKVSNAGYDNIRFICTPGSEVHSYLVQIYPLASLYNTLLNVLNESEAAKMTTEETDNYIANIIAQTEYTSGGVVVNDTVLGGQFAVYEFDASAVEGLAAGYLIQPDADYLIVVQAAFDETAVDSDSYGDLTVCHVKTPKRDLVGSPQVGIDITAYYNSYKMSLNAEGGCHYLYFLGAPKSEIDQYINAYGETMYRDFLRHYGSRVDVSQTGLYEHTTSDTSVDITQEQSATAIALDINGSPAPSINRRNFPLKQKPDNRLPGDGKITEWGRIGATIMYFNLEMDENTKYVNYALVTPGQAETWKNSDETTRMTEAKRLRKEGWHIVNPNYKIDTDLQVPTGTAWSGYDYQNELEGNTEYAFVYSAENGFGDVTDLMISETFKTLPLVKDKPEECKAEVEFTAKKTGRTSIEFDIKYDENTALYRWQQIAEEAPSGQEVPYPENADPQYRDTWLYYFFDFRGIMGDKWPYEWKTTPDGTANTSHERIVDFKPGMRYRFLYMAEDWNGVCGPVKMMEATTLAVNAGPNPTLVTSWTKEDDGTYTINFTGNDDVGKVMYFAATIGSTSSEQLMLDWLLEKSPMAEYDEYIDAWMEHALTNGLSTNEASVSRTFDPNASKEFNQIYVCAAVAIGDDNGTPVYTAMDPAVYTAEGGMQHLTEYLGVDAKAAVLKAFRSNAMRASVPTRQLSAKVRYTERL